MDETIAQQIPLLGSSPYLTSFDAVEQIWRWIPFQSHSADYALQEVEKIGVQLIQKYYCFQKTVHIISLMWIS